ncbi:carnitine O-acetyltransferase CAT2 [Rhizophagus irregularis DAOM 197198w]|uniref:Carnitine O-acetyltransferase, mitochondrial n=1 Tax=Rhizophagus irregularis (strain DAOM 197198w) TaxID=1432141 RepID=A0A015NGM2_RHIIW|nr:carnitine O-acetyltransferase CAT2 [Rhizophagus irregularis DAOM 197198w]
MSFKFVLSRSFVRSTNKPTQQLLNNMARRNASAAIKKPTIPYLEDNSVGPMLRYQKSLPKLPVPALKDTLEKYLKSVRPLVSSEEYAKTEAAVAEFQKPGGIGEELQKRLLAKANNPNVINWLEDWWNEVAYFGYRDPIVVYVSYFFAYKDDKIRRNPATRAAAITTAALEFRRQVINQQLEPEYSKGLPLCMDSYKFMFNACRYPSKPSDYEVTFDPATNNHITIIRKNKIFILDLVKDGIQLSTAEIESQLQKIYELAGNTKDPPIGVLTTENRDNWTEYRKMFLAADPKHEQLLKKIESSMFALCLDDSSPITVDEISRACLAGDGRNRYFDKSLQFIVFENGKAGFNGEHSSMDGTPTSRLNDFVCNVIANNKVDHGSPNVRSGLPVPQQLHFNLTSEVLSAISKAEKNYDDHIAKHDLRVLAYEGYGKNVIKKLGASPDAYVQMIIQLAYYKMYGTNKATYESAQTRKFQHGRTEVCRTVSVDSVNWVKAMEDQKVPIEVKAELGYKAINAHVKYMAEAVEGRGCDRHLFGLRMSLKSNEKKPTIFTDPAYAKSTHWNLSTSQLSSEYFQGYGWGEVVPDGL